MYPETFLTEQVGELLEVPTYSVDGRENLWRIPQILMIDTSSMPSSHADVSSDENQRLAFPGRIHLFV